MKRISFFLKIMFIQFIIPLCTSVSLDNMWEHVYPCISLVFVIFFGEDMYSLYTCFPYILWGNMYTPV